MMPIRECVQSFSLSTLLVIGGATGFSGQRHDRPNALLVRFLPAALIGWQRAAKPDVAAGGRVHANDLGTANADFADAASHHDVADCFLTDTTTGHHMNSSGGAEDDRCEAFDSLERGGGTPRREYPPHAANDERLERLSEVGSAAAKAGHQNNQG